MCRMVLFEIAARLFFAQVTASSSAAIRATTGTFFASANDYHILSRGLRGFDLLFFVPSVDALQNAVVIC